MAGQLDLRSNERSKSNFDCRNGFLGVDYIGFDTLHGKIEHFTQNAKGGGPTPIFFSRNQSKITNEACMQKSSSKTVDLLPPPNWALVIEFVIAPLSASIYVSFVACC